MLDIKDKKIAVIGLSRTGLASVEILYKLGADVVASDTKSADQLSNELDKLKNIDIEYELGSHGPKCLDTDMIIVSPGVPLDIPFFKKASDKDIPIISEIELAYHLTDANIIAITGTNGKTTTTSLISDILKEGDIGEVKAAGNIGIPLVSEAIGLTEKDWLVVEVSSFQLETIKDFKPDISVYLNFTPDHLDRHKTVKNYWEAKKRIFENQKSDDLAVVNYDDDKVMESITHFPGKVYGVSLEREKKQGISLNNDKLYVYENTNRIDVLDIKDIPLLGRHNIENTAFSVMASYLAGVSIENIKKAVKNFKATEHRLEIIKKENDITIIDDSKATNPDAAVKAIESFENPLILIAGGQDRNADFSELAKVIKNKVKTLVLLGETSFKIKEEVLNEGFPNINIHIAEDMKEAVKKACDNVIEGDCLLLSPGSPSWDMYSSYKERGRKFREAINNYCHFK